MVLPTRKQGQQRRAPGGDTEPSVQIAAGDVVRIDPTTGAVVPAAELSSRAYAVMWASDRLWVLDDDGRIEMVVPGSREPVVERLPKGTCAIAPSADGGVWISDCDLDLLHRVDTGLEIVETLALPPLRGDLGCTTRGRSCRYSWRTSAGRTTPSSA